MLKSSLDKATGFEKRFENIPTVVFEDSTLAEKNWTRLKYLKDPINMLKKAKLDGALDCNDSGLFE